MPHRKARAKAVQAPASTCRGVSQPCAAARGGPRRSGVSVPRRKSPTSLNRLVPIWIRQAARAAARNGAHSMAPRSCQATALPASTGDNETESVRGRSARNQARQGDGRTNTGRKIAESGFYRYPALSVPRISSQGELREIHSLLEHFSQSDFLQ